MRTYMDDETKSPGHKKEKEANDFKKAVLSQPAAAAHNSGGRFRLIVGVGVIALALVVFVMVFDKSGQSGHMGETRPKVLVVTLNLDGASAEHVGAAVSSNKAPNLQMAAKEGQLFSCHPDSGSPCASSQTIFDDLTGAQLPTTADDDKDPFEGGVIKSFLVKAKALQLTTTVVAPSNFFSAGSRVEGTEVCSSIGIIDQECYQQDCSTAGSATCNANTKTMTTKHDIALVAGLTAVAEDDVVYVVLDVPVGSKTQTEVQSGVTQVDAILGQLVDAAVARSGLYLEKWLVVVSTTGGQGSKAVFGAAAYINTKPIVMEKLGMPTSSMSGLINEWMGTEQTIAGGSNADAAAASKKALMM